MTTIPLVNLDRYMGKWYELAKIPVIWEKDCAYGTAEYKLQKNGSISIKNTCYSHCNQPLFSYTGSAVLLSKNMMTPGNLSVTFDKMPNEGTYLIHWTDYDNYAVVGSPTGNVWILGRKQSASKYEMDCLVTYVKNLGYNVRKLEIPDETEITSF